MENSSFKDMIRNGFLSSTKHLELDACVRSQREDYDITRRENAIFLMDDGKSSVQITKFPYLDDYTISGWRKTYREGGWDTLFVDGWKGDQSRLTASEEAVLCDWPDGRSCRYWLRSEPVF